MPGIYSSKKNSVDDLRKDPKELQKYRFVHHFVPHPIHRTRAGLLSTRAFFVYLFLISSSVFVFKYLPSIAPGVLGYASNINIKDLLTRTNTIREENGLKALNISVSLSDAAKKKAEDMFKNDYWAHSSPGGKEPWDFILAEKYDYLYAGENLAKNFNSSKDVVAAWYNSPSHRDNLLSKNYDEVGFAVVNGVLNGYETTLVVQMFGRPRGSDSIAVANTEQALVKVEKTATSSTPALDTEPAQQETRAVLPKQSTLLAVNYPVVDVAVASKVLAILFSGFVIILLLVDVWYSGRKSIVKYTGHTLLHVMFLIASMIGVLITVSPGIIL